MPLSVEDLLAIVKQLGLSVSWFDEAPKEVLDELGVFKTSPPRFFCRQKPCI
jgi:hypothetical protein